jgi:radical SAM superfamily enzyme YgiQ (UPF0313 family)
MRQGNKVVILFYPEDDEGFAWHPFAYQRLAPVILESGFKPVVIDQRVQKDWRKLIEEHLDGALWIGFSLISGVMIQYALEVANLVKDLRPSLPVIFGGWHPTCLPKQTLQHPLVDYVVVGSGEEIVEQLSRYLQGRVSKPDRSYGKEDLGRLTNDFTGFKSVTPTTSYDWRLGYKLIPDMDLYRSENNIAALFSAISCPYGKCSFCSIVSMYRFAMRDTKDVLDEIEYLTEDRNFTSVNFHDGLFFTAPKLVMPLIKGFKERGFHMQWKAKARANCLQRFSHEEISLIKETGLRVVAVGLESGSQRMLKKMRKGTKPSDAVDLVRICKDFGIELQTTFMSGLPGDTVDDLKMTLEQIEELRAMYDGFYYSSFFFLPAPGTEAFDEFVNTGGEVPDSLEGWSNVKWREPNKINKLHWLNPRERDEFMRVYHDYFDAENKAKRVSWSHEKGKR